MTLLIVLLQIGALQVRERAAKRWKSKNSEESVQNAVDGSFLTQPIRIAEFALESFRPTPNIPRKNPKRILSFRATIGPIERKMAVIPIPIRTTRASKNRAARQISRTQLTDSPDR